MAREKSDRERFADPPEVVRAGIERGRSTEPADRARVVERVRATLRITAAKKRRKRKPDPLAT